MSKLLVDGATGSNELILPLQKLGLPAVKAKLEYGDVAFMGRGERGAKLYIGIELKKVTELAASFRSGRFQGHQLLGMVNPESGFDRRYLLIEGDFHHDADGRATIFRGRGRARPIPAVANAVAFEQEIINVQTRGGLWVRHTTCRRDTLRFITAAFRYWTDKDLDEHKSHLAIYAPDLDKGLFTPPSDFRKALTVMLPGIGLAVSGAVEQYVGSTLGLREQLLRVLRMQETEWALLQIPSRNGSKKLGASRARNIMEALK